jgi:uncharacterized protein
MSRVPRPLAPPILPVILPVILPMLSLGLSGCAGHSVPLRYYTLSDVSPASPPPELHGTGTRPPSTRLAPVALPAELDRQEIVTHSTANQVQVHESNRWAAPLDSQIRRTLSNDLAARVGVDNADPLIVDFNVPAGREPTRKLTVTLSRLTFDAQCGVALKASWSLQGGGVQGQAGIEEVQQPSAVGAACPAEAAATLSQALAALADRLAPSVMANAPPL